MKDIKGGIKMRVVKANSSLGRKLVEIGQNWEGKFLCQVYDKWSDAKQKAWDECYSEFCNTPNTQQFSICSHNTFQFTVSWFTPEGMRLETARNSYLVVFDD